MNPNLPPGTDDADIEEKPTCECGALLVRGRCEDCAAEDAHEDWDRN